MKKIDSLSDFLLNTLSAKELEYLINKLTPLSNSESNIKLSNSNQFEIKANETNVINTIYTLSKRELKYGNFKMKLLIQRPKTVQKLINSIQQIAKSDGGLADEMVKIIIKNLETEKIINNINENVIEWLR